jgi:hypothetical protein
MKWSEIGEWLKANAGSSTALVASLLTGNVPAAVAAGVAMVSSATGQTKPEDVFAVLSSDPATRIRLAEIEKEEAANIRTHLEVMAKQQLDNEALAHEQQQNTIRNGDNATDEYVRRTRPMMARQSWVAAAVYVIAFEGLHGLGLIGNGASWELAMLLLAPASAYLGFRSFDKRKEHNI